MAITERAILVAHPVSEGVLEQRLPSLSVFPELVPFITHSPWLIERLVRLDHHNKMKSDHSWRMGAAAVGIAERMQLEQPLQAPFVEAALGHDYGFVEVANVVTDKQDRLTADEEIQMRRHPGVAVAALEPDSKVVVGLVEAVHHYQPDIFPLSCTTDFYYGTEAYPDGLPKLYARDIPRILSALDKYDALRDPARTYKAPMSHEEACEAILSLRDQEGNLIYNNFSSKMAMIADVWDIVREREIASQETLAGL